MTIHQLSQIEITLVSGGTGNEGSNNDNEADGQNNNGSSNDQTGTQNGNVDDGQVGNG